MKDKKLLTVLKGMIVGGTMLVPGCSGGSMAMILGVYNQLVTSVSSFFKHKRQSALFLALFALGGGVGMLLFAKPLLRLIERFPMPMLYLFLGARWRAASRWCSGRPGCAVSAGRSPSTSCWGWWRSS